MSQENIWNTTTASALLKTQEQNNNDAYIYDPNRSFFNPNGGFRIYNTDRIAFLDNSYLKNYDELRGIATESSTIQDTFKTLQVANSTGFVSVLQSHYSTQLATSADGIPINQIQTADLGIIPVANNSPWNFVHNSGFVPSPDGKERLTKFGGTDKEASTSISLAKS
jgi:hypothetical protein